MIEKIEEISDWIWGPPMVILLVIGGIFLTVRLGFFQFRYVGYIFKQTIGSLFTKNRDKNKTKGTITPFQALTSGLASTVGAGNITGVPVAIMFGGPGAIFWMWVIALWLVLLSSRKLCLRFITVKKMNWENILVVQCITSQKDLV